MSQHLKVQKGIEKERERENWHYKFVTHDTVLSITVSLGCFLLYFEFLLLVDIYSYGKKRLNRTKSNQNMGKSKLMDELNSDIFMCVCVCVCWLFIDIVQFVLVFMLMRHDCFISSIIPCLLSSSLCHFCSVGNYGKINNKHIRRASEAANNFQINLLWMWVLNANFSSIHNHNYS